MMGTVADHVVMEDLFFEQDIDILASTNYKHGLLRSLLVFSRSILFARPEPRRLEDFVAPSSSLAVVFFPNESHAVSHAPARVGIGRVLRLDVRSLGLVRQQLGLRRTIRETARFVRQALKLKGRRYVGRLTYPLLGWLVYRTFQSALTGKSGVTVVTTNMQHPLSIAVAWAAVDSGQASDFFEHATTPRLVFRDRGYRNYYVQFPHTRQMMIELGASPDRVHTLQKVEMATIHRLSDGVRTVGVCINNFDSIESIVDVTDVLLNRGLKAIYRVHDADPRVSQLKRLATRRGVGFDSARASRIQEFLQRVDLVVSGNSNVIADALTARKPVIYYWAGSPMMFDYYGVVGHYQLPHATDKAEFDAVLNDAVAC